MRDQFIAFPVALATRMSHRLLDSSGLLECGGLGAYSAASVCVYNEQRCCDMSHLSSSPQPPHLASMPPPPHTANIASTTVDMD